MQQPGRSAAPPTAPVGQPGAGCVRRRRRACTHFTAARCAPPCRCTFVQYNRPCLQDVHHVDYLATFYCRQGEGRIFVALGFILWMALLFWVMSKVAEDFLVPALEVRACLCI